MHFLQLELLLSQISSDVVSERLVETEAGQDQLMKVKQELYAEV